MDSEFSERFDDEAIARLLRFGGEPLLFEMIDLLAAGAPARLTVARDAIADGDAEAARGVLHSLKSSAGQMGAIGVQTLCERAEGLAAAGDVRGVAALLPALQSEVDALLARLAVLRRGTA
ncbi:MAG: Hpt domain-containing protein [Gemmatimonadaceae bacterium]